MKRAASIACPMYHRIHRLYLFFILVMCVMLFSCITVGARTIDTDFGTVEAAAMIDKTDHAKITVTMTPDEAFLNAKKGETLYLFLLEPHTSVADSLRTVSPYATKVVDKTVTFTVNADEGGERYRAKYILALGAGADYQVIGETYVENPEMLSENKTKSVAVHGKKGIVYSDALSADAMTLGISHAVIPIVIDDYVSGIAGNPQFSQSTAGVTTHFDPTKIAQLDAQVALLRDAGVHIYFRFILDGSDRNTTEPTAVLYGETARDGASHYGIVMTEKEAYRTANNVFSFFAERYTAEEDATPIDFILGYQVNEFDTWYNIGYDTMDTSSAVKAYADVFRLCSAALRAQSENSLVYVPLSNLYASVKPYLTAFASEMGANTAWGVAIAPYASDAMDDSIWDDAQATEKETSSYLTMKNLELFGDFLSGEQFLYNKKMRSVIIDDFAVHGTSGDTASQERQAASFVYAYYKASSLDFIDAIIWHRIIDGAGEHCSLGLRQLDATEKPVYRLFAQIDTPDGSDAAKEYAKIIGKRKWSQIIDGFKAKNAETAVRYEGIAEEMTAYAEKAQPLLDFSEGILAGFTAGEHVAAVQIDAFAGEGVSQNALTAQIYPMQPTEYGGVTKLFSLGELPRDTKTLYLDLCIKNVYGNLGDGTEKPIRLLLSKDTGDKHIRYVGEAKVLAGASTILAFDISDYMRDAGGADYMKLLVGDLTDAISYDVAASDGTTSVKSEPYAGVLLLREMRYETGIGGAVFTILRTVFVILLILVFLFVLLVIRAQIIRRKRRKMRARKLAAQRAARQRAMAVQQQMAEQQHTVPSHAPEQMPNTKPSGNVRHAQRRPDMYDRRR